jgi:hypothetical protein
MSLAVATAVKSATIDRKHAGAVALAKRYAALIDEAAPAAKYRKPLERLARAVALYHDEDDEQVAEAFETIRTALSEHSVASDLGPKLLAALAALGLTIGAKGGAATDGGATPRASVRDELRARRATRANRAASVDAAT